MKKNETLTDAWRNHDIKHIEASLIFWITDIPLCGGRLKENTKLHEEMW